MNEGIPIAESRRRAGESIALGERVGERWSYLSLVEQTVIVAQVEALTQAQWDADNGGES